MAQTSTLAASDDRNCVSSVNGNLYWNNANGIAVQITAGNGLNFASLGTIGGDYGAAGVTASAVYTNSLTTFSWLQAANTYAKVGTGDLSIYSTTASTQAVTLKASASTAAYSLTMPIAAPAANTFVRNALGGQQTFVTVNGTANQITVTQNTSDMTLSIPSNAILPGGVPIGSIVPIGDAGAWALPANGAIKDGWALCNGQAKPAGSNAGLAANLPDLTDDRFLNGSTVVGGTGGATAKTTSSANARLQKDALNSGQNNHTHGMDHKHYWMYYPAPGAGGSNGDFLYQSWLADGTTKTWISQYSGGVTPGSSRRSYLSDLTGDYYVGTNLATLGPITSAGAAKTSTDNSTATWAAYNGGSATTYVDLIMTQGTIADIRPKYFNVVYVMRVA